MTSPELSARQLEAADNAASPNNQDMRRLSALPTEASLKSEPLESNTVGWDGPTDPQNPLNWSATRKNIYSIVISLFILNASVLYFPQMVTHN